MAWPRPSQLWRAFRRSGSKATFAQALRRLRTYASRPRSRALSTARSIALIVLNPHQAEHQRWTAEAEARGATIDILPLAQPFCRADGQMMSFVFQPPRPAYDCIVIGSGLELFEHSWSYAFLDRVNALVRPGGAIVLPKCQNPASWLRDMTLNALFGTPPEEARGPYLTFRKAENGLNRPQGAAHSTLDVYWPLMESLVHGRHDSRLAEVIAALGVHRIPRRKPNPESDLSYLLKSQSYRTSSARTKAPIAEYIVSLYFPDQADLRLADLGAGTGLNSLEMLLNPGPVSSLILVEPRRSYHWDIAAVYEQVRPYLRGPVTLVDREGENYAGPEFDAGLICGVLVMVPQARRGAFLANAWKNLAPGGILMVLENMQRADAPETHTYNDQCCTPQEIDALLERFAPIRYFMNTAKREVPHRSVADHTVFRVIQKPR